MPTVTLSPTYKKLAAARSAAANLNLSHLSDLPGASSTATATKLDYLRHLSMTPNAFAPIAVNDPDLRFVTITPEGTLTVLHGIHPSCSQWDNNLT